MSDLPNLNIIPMDSDGVDSVHPGYGNANWQASVWPLIDNLFSNKSCVIDIGAGNGRRSKFFSNYASEVVAIEIASAGLYKNIVTNNIANGEYIQADFLDYDFGDKKFDVAYCEGSFYWLGLGTGRHDEAFKKIINTLKDDGVVIILEGDWRTHTDDPQRMHDLEKIIKDNNCTATTNPDVKWGSDCGYGSLLTIIRKNNDA